MVQVVPQWQIQETFSGVTTAAVDNLFPLLLGPDYAVRRYTPTNKLNVILGTYAAASPLAATWPGLQVGETVDLSYPSVTMEQAAIRYGNSTTAGTALVAGTTNRVRNASVVWATGNGYSFTVADTLASARVGDAVRLTSGVNTMVSTISALVADITAASVAAAAAAGTNIATAAGSDTAAAGTRTGTAVFSDTALNNQTNWNKLGSVNLASETYTITVSAVGADGAGNAGAWTSVVLTVTAASGTEAVQTVSGITAGTAFNVGSRGAQAKFAHGVSGNDFVLGDTYTLTIAQTYTIPTTVSAGTYVGSLNTTYVVRCTRGGGIDVGTAVGSRAQITVSTTQYASASGVDSGGPYTVTTGVPVVIGNLGVTLTFSAGTSRLLAGDSWTVAVTAAANGAIRTLQLVDPLTSALQIASNIQVEIADVETITVPANRTGAAPLVNWTATATNITLAAGITAVSALVTSTQLPVLWGNAYVTYRALRSANANQVLTITTEADALAAFGPEDIDGVMSYAVRRTISNSNGQPIKCLSVPTDDLAGYTLAQTYLTNRQDFYRMVPLTQNAAIIASVVSTVNQRSGPTVGRWATVMINLALNTTAQLVGGPTVVSTIGADTSTAGNPIQLLTDTAGQFVTLGIRAGDTVRYAYTTDGFGNLVYSTATVAAVLNQQQIRLSAPISAAITPAAAYTIWRNYTLSEQVADWGTRTAAYANRRVTSSWPPAPGRVGTVVPGFHMAASLAGLRCSVAPHQGLTNASLADWDNIAQSASTFAGYLDTLANYGAYIVTQSPTGQVYVRKQLTTDLSDVKHAEDSATVNYDSVAYYFQQLLANTIGKTNVVPSNLALIRASLQSGINVLKSNQVTPTLGSQITDGSVVSLAADPVALDTVNALVNVALPIPLNNGNLVLSA